MIKNENEGLRRSLEKRTRQLERMRSEHRECEADRKRLSEVEKKLERERMKAKMMARRIKEEDDGDPDIQAGGLTVSYVKMQVITHQTSQWRRVVKKVLLTFFCFGRAARTI